MSTIVRWRGLFVYLCLTFAFSWIPALFLANVWEYDGIPRPLRFLIASTVYAVCMGWQPLVAVWIVRRWVDRGHMDDVLATSRSGYYALASVSPLVVAGLAMAVALLFSAARPDIVSAARDEDPSFEMTVMLVAAMCAALSLLWIQALAEEVGWRGYFLSRFMQQMGPFRGLGLHGAIWGLWYAPLLLVTNGGLGASTWRSLTFTVTCMFLGALLGWLRLASKSVLTTTLANSVLTVTAGLPLLLHGEDPGLRGAAYGPAGWVPMSVAVVAIVATKYRDCVRVPAVRPVPQTTTWIVLVPEEPERQHRTLH